MNSTILKFINDANIIVINNTIKKNLIKLIAIYEKCNKWTKIYKFIFNKFKYEFIHFKQYSFVKFEMFLKFSKFNLTSFSKCKYLKMIINSQFTWKFHLIYLKKKFIEKLNIFTALIDFIWKINIIDLKRTYIVIVFFQFIYCALIWYVFNENHEYKQKQNWILTIMKNIQTKTIKIIVEIFKIIAKIALNVELHLLSMKNYLNVILYDFMLRIISNSIYFFIRNRRTLFDRDFISKQIQH